MGQPTRPDPRLSGNRPWTKPSATLEQPAYQLALASQTRLVERALELGGDSVSGQPMSFGVAPDGFAFRNSKRHFDLGGREAVNVAEKLQAGAGDDS